MVIPRGLVTFDKDSTVSDKFFPRAFEMCRLIARVSELYSWRRVMSTEARVSRNWGTVLQPKNHER
jgi:hypothetical protein